jgi:hypothetical protein
MAIDDIADEYAEASAVVEEILVSVAEGLGGSGR